MGVGLGVHGESGIEEMALLGAEAMATLLD
jgi:hypothetical protein